MMFLLLKNCAKNEYKNNALYLSSNVINRGKKKEGKKKKIVCSVLDLGLYNMNFV